MKIRIPKSWVDICLSKRIVVNTYETNRFVKLIGVFCLLKSTTTTGILHNWRNQSQLRTLCKLSRNSFKSTINHLHELGLVECVGHDLKLRGWNHASQIILQDEHDNEFVSFEYDITNDAKIQHYFFAINIKENQTKQRKSFENRLKFNPHIKQQLIDAICITYDMNIHQVEKMTMDEFCERVYQMQNFQFCCGTPGTDIFKFNPDVNRSIVSMKLDWNFKSTKSVSYYKRRLMEIGLTHTEKIGQLVSSTKNRIRLVPGYTDGFNRLLKLPTWNRVDRVHIQLEIA